MRSYDATQPLIFMHVPKTAGLAVRDVVEDWFPDRVHRHYYNENTGRMPRKLPLDRPRFQRKPPVIFGHFNQARGFGIRDYYPQVTQFLTILRDPFDMAVSDYFFRKRVSQGWNDTSRVPVGGLSAFLDTARPNFLNHFPCDMTQGNFQDLIGVHFIDIGITEALPQSLARIAKRLGVTFDPGRLGHVNASPRSETPEPGARARYRARFPLEHEIYDFVRAHAAT